MKFRFIKQFLLVLLALLASATVARPAHAANCSYATGQGTTGPVNWQTYCWLDFSGYSDSAARSSGGQSISYTLTDGTVMAFNLKVGGAALAGVASPSWTGAAIGNTAFLGIAGRPILYQTAAGTTTITISSITLTPPASGTITNYMLVAADGESSNDGESLQYQTNGGGWQLLDQAGPISGSTYPTYTGLGTNRFTETGVAGTVGSYVVGSVNPSQVVTTLVGGGLQGTMFAVRFASIALNARIAGARADPTDQFSFAVKATGTGATLASGTSSGTGLGPFTAAALSSSAALSLTLSQAMSGGSFNAISHYQSSLSCSNAASGSSTPLPSGVTTTAYSFGSLQFGDIVSCTFTETPFPHLKLTKSLAATGRQFANDQFSMTISQGSTVVASTVTTGSGATIATGSTPVLQAGAGTSYTLAEAASGTTVLAQYTAALSCVNAASASTTVLPAAPGGSVNPQLGDVITCTITNTKRAANATLVATKSSLASSDPVNGASGAKAIPGAVVLYSITVQNTGPSTVSNNTVLIVDAVPAQIAVGTAAAASMAQGTPASGLTLNSTTDVRFSSASSAPTSFAGCTYSPVTAYDPAVRYVCINPKGTMAGSTGSPPSFTVSFLSQIR